MNSKLIFIFIFCFSFVQLQAQQFPSKREPGKKDISSSIPKRAAPYWAIGFNPLGLVEPQAAVGVSVAYRFSKRFEAWNEISFLYQNFFYKTSANKNAAGIRYLLQPRYYTSMSKKTFIGPEFRIKHVGFDDTNTFINGSIHDTLKNYHHRTVHTFFGVAIVFGQQYKLNKKGNMFIEITGGVGGKERNVLFKDIASGYEFFDIRPKDGPYVSKNDSGIGLPYLTFAARFRWIL